MISKIEIKNLRTLDIQRPSQPGRPAFISAASGLVIKNDRAFVIADDELSLAYFSLNDAAPGELFTLFEGQLPIDKKERKKIKPDLESLCLIENESFPNGALLAFPSGSKPNRSNGALISLNTDNKPNQTHHFDLSDLYQSLPFQELNIEGALLYDMDFLLFQRGNSKFNENAVLRLDLPLFLDELKNSKKISSSVLKSTHHLNLGQLNEKNLSFTDAAPGLNGQILFLASTEDTDNPYDDGTFHGAVLGSLSSKLQVQWQIPLELEAKPEGLYRWTRNSPNSVLIVTDSDDASVPSRLYEVTLNERTLKK